MQQVLINTIQRRQVKDLQESMKEKDNIIKDLVENVARRRDEGA